MKTKNTQGEWSYAKSVTSPTRVIMTNSVKNGIIAHVSTSIIKNKEVLSDEEIEANAKLISAAPELLKVLMTLKAHHPSIYAHIPEYLKKECNNAIIKSTE